MSWQINESHYIVLSVILGLQDYSKVIVTVAISTSIHYIVLLGLLQSQQYFFGKYISKINLEFYFLFQDTVILPDARLEGVQ